MPIEVYTGKPGNGKTALMMERLVAEAAKAERPIYAAGIDGLEPGLAVVLDDPRKWADCPDGSLVFIDEAWKWFGHLHDATRQGTPPHVLQLAEHRHRGFDFIWTTQGPNQLYPFVRPLIADHYHVVRRFGTAVIDVFKWEELQEDVKSSAKRELAQRTTRTLPSKVFGKWKSAEVHTIKARVPLKVLALPVLLLVAALLGWWAYSSLKPDAFAAGLTAGAASGNSAAIAPSGAVSGATDRREGPKWGSSLDYAKDHLPRFETMPWTAPVYDGRSVTVDPQLLCMSSGEGEDADGVSSGFSCTCMTEQGTVYRIDDAECRRVARFGPPYNPYKGRQDESRREPPVNAPGAFAPSGSPVSGSVISAAGTVESQSQHSIGGGIGGSH